jgi:hypothetical protein
LRKRKCNRLDAEGIPAPDEADQQALEDVREEQDRIAIQFVIRDYDADEEDDKRESAWRLMLEMSEL